MPSWLTNSINPIGNLLKGNTRAVIDPLELAGKGGGGSGTDSTAPSIYDSYLQGVQADLNTLQPRRIADAAATTGGAIVNGQYMAPDDFNKYWQDLQVQIMQAQLDGDVGKYNELQKQGQNIQNFSGTGDADIATQQLNQQIAGADSTTQGLLDLQRKYGEQYATQARNELRASDPTGFDLREQYGNRLSGGQGTLEELARGGPQAPSYEQYSGSQPSYTTLDASQNPRFQGVRDIRLADTGATAAGRSLLEQQTFDELAKAGQPDQALQRSAEQAARARGASSGNILGDASALQESLAVQNAQRGLDAQRRQTAQDFLASGQSTSDKRNSLAQDQLAANLSSRGFNNSNQQQAFANSATTAGFNNDAATASFNNAMNVINQRNQAAQNTFAGQQSQTQQQIGARQQDQNNIQSFLGLPTQAQQGGALQGLQQQAAPFTQGNYTGAMSDPQSGVNGGQWFSSLFGNQQQVDAANKQASAAKKAGQMQAGGAVAGAAITAGLAIF